MSELSEKDLSNIAQFVAATEGNVQTRVIFYLALNTITKINEPREFVKSNDEIAKAIGSDKHFVSDTIQKLKKMDIIDVTYENTGFEKQRTITWIVKRDWKDIREFWKCNSTTVVQKHYGVSSNNTSNNSVNALGNNKDTYIDNSFDREKNIEIQKDANKKGSKL